MGWFGVCPTSWYCCLIARFLFGHPAANTPSAATRDICCICNWFWCCWPPTKLPLPGVSWKGYGAIIPPRPGPAPNLPPIPSSSSTSAPFMRLCSPKSIFGKLLLPPRGPLTWVGSKFPSNPSFLRLSKQKTARRVKIIKPPTPTLGEIEHGFLVG